jgi:hypothetical protein
MTKACKWVGPVLFVAGILTGLFLCEWLVQVLK